MVLGNLTLDINNSYWSCFYKSDISKSLGMNSNFAEFTLRNANEIFVNEVHKKTTLLDIGCGNGKDLNYFRKNGIDAYGIDLNAGDNSQYETNFQSTIGDAHYRMLYSHKYLSEKVKNISMYFFQLKTRGLLHSEAKILTL